MESLAEQFCQVCLSGDAALAQKMLDADPGLARARGRVRPDHRDFMRERGSESGWTALHLASHYGQPSVVKILLKAGADPNALSNNTEANTPLMAAVAGGSTEVVALLLEGGADPFKTNAPGDFDAIKLASEDKKNELLGLFKKSPRVLFENAAPILSVRNLKASLGYYMDLLGFQNADWGNQGFTCVTRDKAAIYLSENSQGGPGTWVWVGVQDAGRLYEEFKAKGARIKEAPQNYPWAYEFRVLDPDDHVLRFGSEPLNG